MATRGRQTRAKLIDAATVVVREVGYARATTRAIAEEAGVAEGTIYRHFPHKAQLFFAAIIERNEPLIAGMSDLVGRAGTGTVRENLIEVLMRLGELRDEVLPLEIALRADPDLAREHFEAIARLPEGPPPGPPAHLAAYLEAERALGRIRADVDAHRVAVVLLATLMGLGMMPPMGVEGIHGALLETAVDLVLRGIEPG